LKLREAGLLFGGGKKSFEKYESGAIVPSTPTKRLLRLAVERPDLFKASNRQSAASSHDDSVIVHEALRAAQAESLYERWFAEPA
jgi:hypothetical protein